MDCVEFPKRILQRSTWWSACASKRSWNRGSTGPIHERGSEATVRFVRALDLRLMTNTNT